MAAMRIVSLLPSATEILFALGLDRQIVGVSHECDFPPAARSKTVVIHSRIPKDAAPAEIDRLVREFSARGESVYSVDAEALRSLARRPRRRSRNFRIQAGSPVAQSARPRRCLARHSLGRRTNLPPPCRRETDRIHRRKTRRTGRENQFPEARAT